MVPTEGNTVTAGVSIGASTSTSNQSLWDQVATQASQNWQELLSKTHSTIQEGAADEVSPWLERTSWLEYLADLDRQELLASIQRPGEGEGREEGREEQGTAEAIWSAMQGLVMHCHQTIATRAGLFMRMEAIRTEKA